MGHSAQSRTATSYARTTVTHQRDLSGQKLLRQGICIPATTWGRLREMAYLRRTSINGLLAEYAERGLRNDSDKIDQDPDWLDKNF